MERLFTFNEFADPRPYQNLVDIKVKNPTSHIKKLNKLHQYFPYDKVEGEITPNFIDLRFSGKHNFTINGKASRQLSMVPSLLHTGFSPVTFKMDNVTQKFDWYPWSSVDFDTSCSELRDEIKGRS